MPMQHRSIPTTISIARSRPSSSTKRQSFRGPRIISGTLYWSWNQWYALKWKDEHPGELAKQGGHAEEVGNALAKNLLDCTGALKTCTDRAIANPKFIRFADLMKNAPDTD